MPFLMVKRCISSSCRLNLPSVHVCLRFDASCIDSFHVRKVDQRSNDRFYRFASPLTIFLAYFSFWVSFDAYGRNVLCGCCRLAF